jgi:hypothetical protein
VAGVGVEHERVDARAAVAGDGIRRGGARTPAADAAAAAAADGAAAEDVSIAPTRPLPGADTTRRGLPGRNAAEVMRPKKGRYQSNVPAWSSNRACAGDTRSRRESRRETVFGRQRVAAAAAAAAPLRGPVRER